MFSRWVPPRLGAADMKRWAAVLDRAHDLSDARVTAYNVPPDDGGHPELRISIAIPGGALKEVKLQVPVLEAPLALYAYIWSMTLVDHDDNEIALVPPEDDDPDVVGSPWTDAVHDVPPRLDVEEGASDDELAWRAVWWERLVGPMHGIPDAPPLLPLQQIIGASMRIIVRQSLNLLSLNRVERSWGRAGGWRVVAIPEARREWAQSRGYEHATDGPITAYFECRPHLDTRSAGPPWPIDMGLTCAIDHVAVRGIALDDGIGAERLAELAIEELCRTLLLRRIVGQFQMYRLRADDLDLVFNGL